MARIKVAFAVTIAVALLGHASLLMAAETREPSKDEPAGKSVPNDTGKTADAGAMGNGMFSDCAIRGGSPKNVDAIKTELGITEAQKGVWENLAVAPLKAKVGFKEMQNLLKVMARSSSPVERFNARMEALELHLNSVREFKAPLEELYNALSAEQRKKADTLLGDVTCLAASPAPNGGTN